MPRIALAAFLATTLAICHAAVAQAPRATRLAFDIPPQPLSDALTVFGRQAGLRVLRRESDSGAEMPATPEVRGELLVEEALQKLLAKSGLQYEFIDERTVRIGPVARISAAGTPEPSLRVAQAEESAAQGQEGAGSGNSDGQSSAQGNVESRDQLEEVVVTAQKREERLQDVPISISVLSGEALDSSTDRGVAEALNRIPGVVNIPLDAQERFGGATGVTIRGVPGALSGGTSGSSTAYYLDAIPFGFIRQSYSPDTSAYDLERVEVLRGPQGTLYGASALNGVVRVLTKDANLNDFQFKARTSAAGTEDGAETYRGDLAVNVPIVQGKLAARAVVGYQDIGGWIDKPIEKDANDREIGNARLKINAQPTDQLSVGLFAWLSRTDIGAPSHSPDGRTSISLVDEWAITDFDAYGLKLGYDLEGFSITSSTSYVDYKNESQLDINGLAAGAGTIHSIFGSTVFAQELYLNSTNEGPWRWTVGGSYRDAKDLLWQLRSINYLAPAHSNTFSESFAVFGELTRVFGDGRYELTGGLRYFEDRVKDIERSSSSAHPPEQLVTTPWSKFDDLAPRVVLTWHPDTDLSVYASYAEGFRSGVNQLPSVGRVAPEFPSVEPDELTNYELGAKGTLLGGRFGFDAAAFFIDWEGIHQAFLVLVRPPNVINTAIVNAGAASGPGLEFGTTFELIDGLTLGANFSWNDLKVRDNIFNGSGALVTAKDDRVIGSAETTVGASADYGFAIGGGNWRGRFSVSANYLSEMVLARTTAGETVRGSTLMSQASFAVVSPGRWTTSLFADNLGNERGFARDPFSAQWHKYFRPRTVGLQFEYQF